MTSERNGAGIVSSSILPLVKRALIRELQVLNDAREKEDEYEETCT